MDIKVLRRKIELDLHEKFPSPSFQQRQVIASVLGVLREAEKQTRTDVGELGSWRDSSFLGVHFDADRASPRRDSGRTNVDDLLFFIKKSGWSGDN